MMFTGLIVKVLVVILKNYIGLKQHTDWRLRFKKGRYFFKKTPLLKKIIERDIAKAFASYIDEIQPDVVHSFVLYMSCAPILEVMKARPHIKWIYSAWGNDLYFYQHNPIFKKDIDLVLPNVDYMFADCKRDIILAKKLGFKGEPLGVFPGGGGYHLDLIEEPIKSIEERSTILIKGYQGEKHRGLNVLKAIEKIENIPPVVFFSTDESLLIYYENSKTLKSKDIQFYTSKNGLDHKTLCRHMNASLLYIGNNLSDGMPNTLLESICFGAFPIQSNPGGASGEIIDHGVNGLLINNCEDIDEIQSLIELALKDKKMIAAGFSHNMKLREKLTYNKIKITSFGML